jgi:cob(I)alamin adenosyltransferase
VKVYTRRGDDGTTGLLHGGQVDKDDARTAAYGTTDELVSALGLARAALRDQPEWHDWVLAVQRDLFVVGAQLATLPDRWDRLEDGVSRVTDAMIAEVERRIDATTDRSPLPEEFVVPGQQPAGAALDLARSVARRAEREVVVLHRAGQLPHDAPLRYLNRCSDELFVLARAVEGGEYTRTRA